MPETLPPTRCRSCKRKLRARESREREYGPDCWREVQSVMPPPGRTPRRPAGHVDGQLDLTELEDVDAAATAS
jgi:hypothetical protein